MTDFVLVKGTDLAKMSSIGKIATERNHRALMEIVMKPGNGAYRTGLLTWRYPDFVSYRRLCGLQGSCAEMGLVQSRYFRLVCLVFSSGHHPCTLTEYPALKVRPISQRELRQHPSQDWDPCHQSVRASALHRFGCIRVSGN